MVVECYLQIHERTIPRIIIVGHMIAPGSPLRRVNRQIIVVFALRCAERRMSELSAIPTRSHSRYSLVLGSRQVFTDSFSVWNEPLKCRNPGTDKRKRGSRYVLGKNREQGKVLPRRRPALGPIQNGQPFGLLGSRTGLSIFLGGSRSASAIHRRVRRCTLSTNSFSLL